MYMHVLHSLGFRKKGALVYDERENIECCHSWETDGWEIHLSSWEPLEWWNLTGVLTIRLLGLVTLKTLPLINNSMQLEAVYIYTFINIIIFYVFTYFIFCDSSEEWR